MKLGVFVDGSFLPSREGATQRIYLLAKGLPQAGVEVVVLHCYRGWSDIKLIEQEEFMTYLLSPEMYYRDPYWLSAIIRAERIDILQMCDPSLILSQGLALKRETGTVLGWEVHEVVSSLLEQLHGTHEADFGTLERLASLCCDYVVCFTEEDRAVLIASGIPSDAIGVFPCGVDLSRRTYLGPNLNSHAVLFLGNMYYEPNYRGVLTIIRQICPEVCKMRKDTVFQLVGTFPAELTCFASNHLIFRGPVDDLDTVFHDASIAIAPIEACSGMRIKILDYMAAGLPVISTSAAAVGIERGGSILIEDNLSRFPERIVSLMDAPPHCRELGRRARRQIERHYNSERITADLSDYLEGKRSCRRRFPDDKLAQAIGQLNVPPPFWLEETIRKGRFASHRCDAIDYPAVIRNHELSFLQDRNTWLEKI